jgi:hypothetical protein
MGQALPAGIPTFEETGWTREGLLEALSNELALPVAAVEVAARFPDEIEPAIVAVLERAAREDLDRPSDRLMFRGIHILGAARSPLVYRPLIDFLRGPRKRVDRLGSAITEVLSQILAGVFDGDVAPLTTLIADIEADEFVRNAALGTLAFLTFDGRIAREVTAEFLRRFEQESTTPAENMAWHGWMEAVAVLGLKELTPRVHAAFEDGRIPSYVATEAHYQEWLEEALKHPEDPRRFRDECLGYIEDAAGELRKYSPEEDTTEAEPAGKTTDPNFAREMDEVVGWMADRMLATQDRSPAHNPHKGVGRNDPCPCGSGKKFKKCCGASG